MTALAIDLAGSLPEDAMEQLAKHARIAWLRRLAEDVGRERWDVLLAVPFDRESFERLDERLEHLRLLINKEEGL